MGLGQVETYTYSKNYEVVHMKLKIYFLFRRSLNRRAHGRFESSASALLIGFFGILICLFSQLFFPKNTPQVRYFSPEAKGRSGLPALLPNSWDPLPCFPSYSGPSIGHPAGLQNSPPVAGLTSIPLRLNEFQKRNLPSPPNSSFTSMPRCQLFEGSNYLPFVSLFQRGFKAKKKAR